MAESGYRLQITIALISLVGVLGGAVIANWDKLFPPSPNPVPPRPTAPAPTVEPPTATRYQPTKPSPGPESFGATSRPAMSARMVDTNLNGGDIPGASFDVENGDIDKCENACRTDPRCNAWTYVYLGYEPKHPNPWCSLKGSVPA